MEQYLFIDFSQNFLVGISIVYVFIVWNMFKLRKKRKGLVALHGYHTYIKQIDDSVANGIYAIVKENPDNSFELVPAMFKNRFEKDAIEYADSLGPKFKIGNKFHVIYVEDVESYMALTEQTPMHTVECSSETDYSREEEITSVLANLEAMLAKAKVDKSEKELTDDEVFELKQENQE